MAAIIQQLQALNNSALIQACNAYGKSAQFFRTATRVSAGCTFTFALGGLLIIPRIRKVKFEKIGMCFLLITLFLSIGTAFCSMKCNQTSDYQAWGVEILVSRGVHLLPV